MADPLTRELRRLNQATRNSLNGLLACWRNEAAFRFECVVSVFLIPLGFYLGGSGVEKALLVGSCLFVLCMELLNSAIEAVVDRVGIERHELSGLAKDLASAAVFVSMLLLFVTWVCLLLL